MLLWRNAVIMICNFKVFPFSFLYKVCGVLRFVFLFLKSSFSDFERIMSSFSSNALSPPFSVSIFDTTLGLRKFFLGFVYFYLLGFIWWRNPCPFLKSFFYAPELILALWKAAFKLKKLIFCGLAPCLARSLLSLLYITSGIKNALLFGKHSEKPNLPKNKKTF